MKSSNIMKPIKVIDGKSNGHTTHPDAQWFSEAGLGLFLHWGVTTVDTDPFFSHEISWCLMKNRLAPNEPVVSPERYYNVFARNFNPDNYNPDKWIFAAAEAGFRYAVLTTKHHDGYALWPSNYGEMSTKNFMGGRDLIRPFVDACRKYGLKVGLYYSPMDWYFFREYNTWDHNFCWDPFESWLKKDVPKSLIDEHKEYCNNQVKELMTNYGKIDLLWFDGGGGEIEEQTLRNLNPAVVINSRLGDGKGGDFKTPERSMPKEQLDGWWELCEIWNKGPWSWTPEGENYKPLSEIVEMFKKVRSMGGNLLINCAPRSNGELPDAYYENMDKLKKWMKAEGYKYMPKKKGW